MPKQRHDSSSLYILIKDGNNRYGLRRFDLLHSHDDPPPLPVRFKSRSSAFFAAIGTKIINMHAQRVPRPVIPVFDVRTLSLSFRSQHGKPPLSQPMYLPVSDRLVALEDECSSELLAPFLETSYWPWKKLPKTPFKRQDVTCHAVHPDGRTIFAGVNNAGTYYLDTAEYKPRWRLHGEWTLPFAGRAHFDPGLDAWVGLSGDPDTLGYLCSCDVVPSTGSGTSNNGRSPPAWKLSKEKLFRQNRRGEKHVGASLVYFGVRTVCLMQYYFSVDQDSRSC